MAAGSAVGEEWPKTEKYPEKPDLPGRFGAAAFVNTYAARHSHSSCFR